MSVGSAGFFLFGLSFVQESILMTPTPVQTLLLQALKMEKKQIKAMGYILVQ